MAKTLHYDFLNNPSLADHTTGTATPDLSITRATSATMVDADGYIREVQSGEARFTGATFNNNLLLQSNQFDTSWTNVNTTDASGASDPDGGTSAWSLSEDGTATVNHFIYPSSTFATVVGKDYTFSVSVKASNRSFVGLFQDGALSEKGYFNLSTGAVGTTSGLTDSGIVDLGGGWYRCWITITADATTVRPVIAIAEADNDIIFDGLSQESLLIYQAQFEEVSGRTSNAPSTYISTTTAAASSLSATNTYGVTNLCKQSEDFTNGSYWVNSTSVDSANTTTAPDGTTTADSLIDNNAGGSGQAFIFQTIVVATTTAYTMSVYAKKNGVDWVAIRPTGFTTPADPYAYFDLTNGAEGTHDSGFSATGIEDAGNGWYRCWVTFTTDAADTSGQFRIYVADGDGDTTVPRDGTSSIYLWGAQLEAKAPAQSGPRNYVATTTAAATETFSAAIENPKGLLVEEARTNICLQSEDITTTWSTAVSAIEANATTAPDGSTTADKLVDDSSTGTGEVRINQTITTATSTAYTFSTFAKADQLGFVYLQVAAMASQTINATYNLSTGAVGTTSVDVDSSGIEDYGNGWYRCWLSFTSDGTDTSATYRVYVADGDDDRTVDLDGTSSIFVWGIQLEAGAFPTSYIPTTTGSVTRNQDVPNTTDVSWVNANAGTFYANATTLVGADAGGLRNNRILQLDDGGSTDRILMSVRGSDDAIANTITNSADTDGSTVTANTITNGTAFRAVLGYADDDMASVLDGGTIATDTTVALPLADAATTFRVGHDEGEGGDNFNGHIAEIAYFNERLANATLVDYSTNGLPTAFPGTVAGDGGHIWPPRANDPRWTQIITDSGITASGNFIDDVHEALEALASTTGAMDDLWKKFKAVYSVTDTSEPFTY